MPMLLHIRGHHLPGIQLGSEAQALVPGDAQLSSWTIPIKIIDGEDGLDFRGTAVQGRPGARFVYLTWGDVGADGSFAMFRRAKLMLADLEPFGADGQHVIAHVDLTDECGGPRCARLRPPALTLEASAD